MRNPCIYVTFIHMACISFERTPIIMWQAGVAHAKSLVDDHEVHTEKKISQLHALLKARIRATQHVAHR